MSSTIQKIQVYPDNVTEIMVICNQCQTRNTHTIGAVVEHHPKARLSSSPKIVIDFEKLRSESRLCHNSDCKVFYKLA